MTFRALTPEEVVEKTFQPTKFREGYDQQEVDLFLDDVVDFISVPHFAIFNIADSCICVSLAVIAVLTLRGVPLEGRDPEAAIPGPADDARAAAEHAEETRP